MDADVIVIGAGAAGLAAARVLAARALHVVVLEARERIGGRVWSHPSARAAVAIELGAEFIHGRAQETTALLRDAGTAAIDTAGESWRLHDDGTLQRDDDDFITAAGIFERTRELGGDESVDRFLRRFDGDPDLQESVASARAFVEGFEAADPAIASALAIAEEWQSGVDSTGARPLGGYGPVFQRLHNACATAGVQIRSSTIVRQISWRPGAVSVETNALSGNRHEFRARAAIVTLPAGVLRHAGDETAVAFDPALPIAKRIALGSIEMGHVVRVVMWFRTAFWEQVNDGRYRNGAFFRSATQPFTAYWAQLPVRGEVIAAWAGGPKATALSGKSQPDIIGLAVDGFGALFGDIELARREFEGAATHDWTHDPFARGAYSYIAVEGQGARAALARPLDDTLFFAGEATADDGQGGTVNGALETGERAAREVTAILDPRSGSRND